jgi:cysteinyl-tRNA synthetase
MGHVFNLNRLANRILEDKTLIKSEQSRDVLTRIQASVGELGRVLGLFGQDPEDFLHRLRQLRAQRKEIDPAVVDDLIRKRQSARKDKDFEQADAIRDQLGRMGVEIQDTPEGTKWDVA